jgi:BMFP domain-containing protein YqiC
MVNPGKGSFTFIKERGLPEPFARRITRRKEGSMQTDNRLLDGMARFFTNAAGAAQAFKAEMETMIKTRMEKVISGLDFVPREEFDAVKTMAAKARAENQRLHARLQVLEEKLGVETPKEKARPKRGKARGKL